MLWFINSSLSLDILFLRTSDWNFQRKLEFIFVKYTELFLLLFHFKKFKLGKSFTKLFGKKIYYDSPYGIAGYQSMIARHQKMLKYVGIKNVGNVIDVGANVGFYSMMIKEVFPKAGIYSVEPIFSVFECLKKNVSPDIAKPFNLAMSDVEGILSMSFDELESARSQVITQETNKNKGRKLSVRSTTLDKFCEENKLSSIDLLKIDTESYEAHVLRGAKETLKKTRYLSIEINIKDNPNYSFTEINSLLYSNSFNFQLVYFRNYTDKGSGPLPVGDFFYKNLVLD